MTFALWPVCGRTPRRARPKTEPQGRLPVRVWPARLLVTGLLAIAPLTIRATPTSAEARNRPPAPAASIAERRDVPGPSGAAARGAAPPATVSDLGAWLDYKRQAQLRALPDEARLFYRRGLLAQWAGDSPQATRLVRGAAELDPGFVSPHLTLAAWSLGRDPSQALLRCVLVLDIARRDFLTQVEMIANLLFFALHGLFVTLLATALVILAIHQGELRHIWQERLSRRLRPTSARVWSWVILLVPFAAGVGLALPATVFLAMLWPVLRPRERAIPVALLLALAASPFAGHLLGRLATPLREDRGPLFGVARLPNEAWSPARHAHLQRLAAEHPDNPFLQFGLGWSARQADDLAGAELAYRRTLELWPRDARALNNLANVLVGQDRLHEAIDLYRAAMAADPGNAAAPFNLSQVYTRQFEYRAASEAAALASALDFELVKNQQALGTEDGLLPLADQWIAPTTFWKVMADRTVAARAEPALPPVWHRRIETSGWPFAAAVLLLSAAGLVLGFRWQRTLPLRPCHNCGRVVCRRCSQRRRELALCPACAEQAAQAENLEFARVLLARHRGHQERGRRVLRTVLAVVVPGYGLLSFHRVFRATALIAGACLLAAPSFGIIPPFSYQPRPRLEAYGMPSIMTLLAWAVLYATSLLGYLSEVARVQAQAAAAARPVRSRPRASQPTAKAA